MPTNKVWTAEDLHNTDHPEWFVFGLLLLYQKLRGGRMLYLSSSIHIRYSELSLHQQRKIDKLMANLMDVEKSFKAIKGSGEMGEA